MTPGAAKQQTPPAQTIPPAKPSPTTGAGGPSVGIPVVGKPGK